jgi:hypothetical protein
VNTAGGMPGSVDELFTIRFDPTSNQTCRYVNSYGPGSRAALKWGSNFSIRKRRCLLNFGIVKANI